MSWLTDIIDRSTQAMELLRGRNTAILSKWTFNLNAAGYQEINIQGNFIYVIDATDGLANIDAQFSRRDDDLAKHNFTKGFGFKHPFDKLHISWNAQTSKTLTLLVCSLAFDVFDIVDNRFALNIDSLLTQIRDELMGSSTGIYDTEKTIGTTPAVKVLAANTARKAFILSAKAANTGTLYIGFDNSVTTTKYFCELSGGQTIMIDDYRGDIYAIASAAGQLLGFGEW